MSGRSAGSRRRRRGRRSGRREDRTARSAGAPARGVAASEAADGRGRMRRPGTRAVVVTKSRERAEAGGSPSRRSIPSADNAHYVNSSGAGRPRRERDVLRRVDATALPVGVDPHAALHPSDDRGGHLPAVVGADRHPLARAHLRRPRVGEFGVVAAAAARGARRPGAGPPARARPSARRRRDRCGVRLPQPQPVAPARQVLDVDADDLGAVHGTHPPKDTSSALVTPAVRPGAACSSQYRFVCAMTLSGVGAPHSLRSSVVCASPTSVTS